MANPDFDLILAIRTTLLADAIVSGFIGNRFYDPPPQGTPPPTSPYMSLGPTTISTDEIDCVDGEEITVQLDVWTWGSGENGSSVMCRKVCNAVKRALHEVELAIDNTALVVIYHELTRVMRDPDGIHNHGVVQFTAVVETP